MRSLLAVLMAALGALAGGFTAPAQQDRSGMSRVELRVFLDLDENGKTPEKLKKRVIRNGCGGHTGCYHAGLGYIEDNPNMVIDEIVLRSCRKIATHERFSIAMDRNAEAARVGECIFEGLQTASGKVETDAQCKTISKEKMYNESQACFRKSFYYRLTIFCNENRNSNGSRLACLVKNTRYSIQDNGGDTRWLTQIGKDDQEATAVALNTR